MTIHHKSKEFQNADRIIDKKELKHFIPYSDVHIQRLEKSGDFPKRIKLGPNRVGWSLQEICEWIEQRKVARDSNQASKDGGKHQCH